MNQRDGAEAQDSRRQPTIESGLQADESQDASSEVTTLMQPVREGERIASLDVLRGVAILGIFFVNMQLFAMPFASFMAGDLTNAPASEHWAWAFVRTLFEYKFISMFSLLFGAGLIMQMMRADVARRPFVPFFLRRLFVLGLFGLVHFSLLWYGDILFIYAWIGLLLMFLRNVSVRTFLWLAGISLTVAIVIGTGCGLMQFIGQSSAEPAPGAQVEAMSEAETDAGADEVDIGEQNASAEPESGDPESSESATDEPQFGFDAMMASKFQPFVEPWISAETVAFREGPFLDALLYRNVMYGFAFLSAAFGYGWHVLAMFCIGAAMMKVDFFRPHRLAWHKRMMVIGLLIGLPIEVGVTVMHVLNEHQMNFMMLVANVIREVGSVALCLGYVGAICTLCSLGIGRLAFRGIANVGRMALSTYLLSTIVSTFLMYWWGLGWFGTVSRVEQCLLVVAIYVGLMIFSTLWLIPFRMGPFEWLWRTMSYARPQPLLRTASAGKIESANQRGSE